LELVYSDVCGSMKTTSRGGAWYFVTFIDNFLKKTHVYILKMKGIQSHAGKSNWHEDQNLAIRQWNIICVKKIWWFFVWIWNPTQTSVPYTPQQNGIAEQGNKTIMECTRSMIHAQGFDLEFWAEAVNMTIYIKNWCPTKAFDSKTPQEAWTSTKPDVCHLKVFCCKTFTHILDENRSKLKSKSIPCVFLEYCEKTKAYRLMCRKQNNDYKSKCYVPWRDERSSRCSW
jgi:hypothetical protein